MSDKEIKSKAIMEFVNMMIGALDGGFVDKNNPTLSEIHRVAENYIKDKYGIIVPTIDDDWGEEIAELCGLRKSATTKNK